ncbi:MAG: hypothetical protein A2508_00170 [Candidatus Lambdaproteobacteria bacterium RIFOXYD12_FULL_49_8]|uniref:Uncharacterized protein n=1 Tax=Candidatus Lambdaproteobacteria bacterium RIFOXYD2_FULL_50_16 TaxID=1817772 RepID=A0A1F6G5L4_9PROT|nr:MAG: hypothetical protein A2527_01635 [Candidatus Lambdaproteobacteria bacterium RIFOXYD2_FULL_50_16]OGG97975.1 MAG: hypothetical protein A2508_00170 [Candidatus Lambdaproteobacteria bacterium RIFOXYD12_FULL_49_8]
MDIEFHYYLTGIIAYRAGFSAESAHTIAYASQFVDDNNESLNLSYKNQPYRNFISQTMNILKPKESLMRIYPIFHFLPGEIADQGACRIDGMANLLNCTPNSSNANRLMEHVFGQKAIKDNKLHQIGVASHTYADTWAHQNFVGWHNPLNGIGKLLTPNIGHADARHHPDWVGHIWQDERLAQKTVNNNIRFIEASEHLYNHYLSFLGQGGKEYSDHSPLPWTQLKAELLQLMGETWEGDELSFYDQRVEGYLKHPLWKILSPSGEHRFNELAWQEAAIKHIPHFPPKIFGWDLFPDEYHIINEEQFEKSDWYKFKEAVREQEEFVINNILADTYQQMEINLVNYAIKGPS